jgi:fido (protein-threonine AMPylation protein)
VIVDPYVDAENGVLRNRLGIIDPRLLREAEAGLTLAALADLGTRVLSGGYDLGRLRSFHREVFGDVYPWAGEIRKVASPSQKISSAAYQGCGEVVPVLEAVAVGAGERLVGLASQVG